MLNHLRHEELVLPPELLLRAYLDLIHTVFVDLRSSARMGESHGEYVYSLAQAMHNISSLIGRYDCGYVNDEKYRRMYLQPFDELWRGKDGSPIQLQFELDEAIAAIASPAR
jgi:hypothetical protein